ncbi:MAG: S1 family peptidase [Rickettsiales bacterium]
MRHLLSLLLLITSTTAYAQQTIYYKVSSGTGFVINNDGHVITNAHVVRECKDISILTPAGEENAVLVAEDPKQDLAVLKTDYISPTIAPLRWNISDLRVGDNVIVMGYPGPQGATGKEVFKKTQVKALKGPTGEARWIQLASVAAHGNSGGPVLDGSGNVIAVISGMAVTYKADKAGNPSGNPIGQTDIAITLASLQDFLRDHAINFYESASGMLSYPDEVLLDNARHFTVPVRCIQDIQKR